MLVFLVSRVVSRVRACMLCPFPLPTWRLVPGIWMRWETVPLGRLTTIRAGELGVLSACSGRSWQVG